MESVCRHSGLRRCWWWTFGRKLVSYLSSGLHFDLQRLALLTGSSQHFFIRASSDLCLLFSLTAFPFDTFVLNRYFSMKLSMRPALFYSLILMFSIGHKLFRQIPPLPPLPSRSLSLMLLFVTWSGWGRAPIFLYAWNFFIKGWARSRAPSRT